MIVTLTPKEAAAILREHGMRRANESHIRAGLDCGAYPFGVMIPFEKSHEYEIYKTLLMKWIAEREGEEEPTC